MIESIEKLRELVKSFHSLKPRWDTLAAIEEVEREIERDYMKLPVDAEGVPIHVGDVVDGWGTLQMHGCGKQPVHGMYCVANIVSGIEWRIDNEYGFEVEPNELKHVKPRTLEDVLRDVWDEALDYAKSDIWRNPDEVFAERADEIRELMEVDA